MSGVLDCDAHCRSTAGEGLITALINQSKASERDNPHHRCVRCLTVRRAQGEPAAWGEEGAIREGSSAWWSRFHGNA